MLSPSRDFFLIFCKYYIVDDSQPRRDPLIPNLKSMFSVIYIDKTRFEQHPTTQDDIYYEYTFPEDSIGIDINFDLGFEYIDFTVEKTIYTSY
jgi:hypothetical protein